jgi:hypothetical protein
MRTRNDQGEVIYNPNIPESLDTVLEEFFQTQVGKKLVADGLHTTENFELIVAAIDKLYLSRGNEEITSSVMADVVATLLAAGDLIAPEVEERELTDEEKQIQEEQEIARMKAAGMSLDKNNRPLSQAQISWGEMTRWTEQATPGQIQARCHARNKDGSLKDPAYASFYAKKVERDNAAAVPPVVLNARPTNPSGEVTPELQAWVAEYIKTPTSKVRLLLGASSNPGGWEAYTKSFNAASAAGLI